MKDQSNEPCWSLFFCLTFSFLHDSFPISNLKETHTHIHKPKWFYLWSLSSILLISFKNVIIWASLVAQTVKLLPVVQKTWVQSLGQEHSLEKGMATHSSILAGEFHRESSLVGCSPWGHKELDRTEWLTLSLFHFKLHGAALNK